MILDTRRDRVIMFGGLKQSWIDPLDVDEVWALSLRDQRWERLTPAGVGPPARFDHIAALDSGKDRMLVFGGLASSAAGLFDDVWTLSLGHHPRWSRLEPEGEGPSGRYGHSAIYEPDGQRLLIYGGIDTAGFWGWPYVPPRDVWELGLRGRHRWRQLKPRSVLPIPEVWTGVAYDPVLGRLLVGDLLSFWALELELQETLQPGRPGARVDPSGKSRPGPASSDAIGQAAYPDEELRVYDVTGRLILTKRLPDSDAWLEAIRLNPRAEAAGLVPGVYFAQRRDRAGAMIGSRALVIRR